MLAKKMAGEVREHSEEREWLRNLGAGNILMGIQHLIEQTKGEESKDNSKKKTGR